MAHKTLWIYHWISQTQTLYQVIWRYSNESMKGFLRGFQQGAKGGFVPFPPLKKLEQKGKRANNW